MIKELKRKKAHVDTKYCVACGVCKKKCPIGAISIYRGMWSKVDSVKCVGCSKCSKFCPASAIEMKVEES